MKRIEIETRQSTELIDITGKVKEIVKSKTKNKSGNLDSGICVVFTRHTTSFKCNDTNRKRWFDSRNMAEYLFR
jgi:thiamine phosphate synthase YjbQ (UPF0047 family)